MITSGKGIYTGETSRSLWERAGEHMGAASGLDRGSHMVKHWFLDHPEEGSLPKFKFRVLGTYKDCLTRQIKEAIRVQHRPNNLNSKGEFGGGTIPRLVVEKSDWERKVESIEKAKTEAEEDKKWENFMVGRGNPNESNNPSTEVEKVNQLVVYRTNTATVDIATPCSTVAKEENEAHTHSAETIQQISAGAVPSTPCPAGQGEQLVTIGPHSSRKVIVRGGRKGKGSKFMTVNNISDTFKEISAKNKFLEQVSGKNGPGGSPKRKIEFMKNDLDSPNKRSKFETTRHFWKKLQGEEIEQNLKQNTLMGEIN